MRVTEVTAQPTRRAEAWNTYGAPWLEVFGSAGTISMASEGISRWI